MVGHRRSCMVSEIVSKASSKGSSVLGALELIVENTVQFARSHLYLAEHYWQEYAPDKVQSAANTAFRAAGVPLRAVKKHSKAYLDNFVSSRYIMYQAIGGTASVATKVALSLTLLDDPGYANQLWITIGGAIGQTVVQAPAYLLLEHRKYGQPVKELAMEYFAWRGLEAFVLNLPTYFIAAGQANVVEQIGGGVTGGALSTSLIPGTPAKWFSNGLDTPVMHAIYRRLQIRKKNHIPADGKEVFYILKNGVYTAGSIIKNGFYNHMAKPIRSFLGLR